MFLMTDITRNKLVEIKDLISLAPSMRPNSGNMFELAYSKKLYEILTRHAKSNQYHPFELTRKIKDGKKFISKGEIYIIHIEVIRAPLEKTKIRFEAIEKLDVAEVIS